MLLNEIIYKITSAINKPLPADKAHLKLSPLNIVYDIPEHAKNASVTLLFYPKDNNTYLVFTKRNKYNGIHSNQICFPGGKYEPYDKSLLDTASRELFEEIGLSNQTPSFIGHISKIYIPVSNHLVTPFIAYLNDIPNIKTNPEEVNSVFYIPVSTLLNLSTTYAIINSHNKIIKAPSYIFENYIIWGATAMITAELIEILK